MVSELGLVMVRSVATSLSWACIQVHCILTFTLSKALRLQHIQVLSLDDLFVFLWCISESWTSVSSSFNICVRRLSGHSFKTFCWIATLSMTLCFSCYFNKMCFSCYSAMSSDWGPVALQQSRQCMVWKSPMLHAVALHAPAQWAVLTHTWCIRTRRVSLFCNCMVGTHLSLFPVCLYRIPSNQRRDKVVSLDDRHGNCFSIHFVKHMRLSPFLRVFFLTLEIKILPPPGLLIHQIWFLKSDL